MEYLINRLKETISFIEDEVKKMKDSKAETVTESNQPEYLNTKEAMNFIKCCSKTLYHYRLQGLKSYKIGRKVMYKTDELSDFINSHQA